MSEDQDVREEARRRRREMEEGTRFKFATGENVIRLLKTPASDTTPPTKMEFFMHEHVGPDDKWLRCGKDYHTGKGRCWLCKQIPKLEDAGKFKKATRLQPVGNCIVQLAVYDPETEDWRGPLSYTCKIGKTNRSMYYKLIFMIGDQKRDYLDPQNGYNATIVRTGKKKNNTEYSMPTPDAEPSRVPKRILADLKPFSEILFQYSEERQKNAYFGTEPSSEEDEYVKKKRRVEEDDDERDEREDDDDRDSRDDDDEDDRPKSKKRSRDEDDDDDDRPAKKRKREEDDDEDDDRPAKKKFRDDDEDEDERPAKKSKRVVEEDDDDDDRPKSKRRDDDDDEDEDERPAKKSKRHDDDDDDDVPPKKSKRVVEEDDDDDEDVPPKKSKRVVEEDDDDDDDRPAKKSKRVDDDDDDRPAKKKKR